MDKRVAKDKTRPERDIISHVDLRPRDAVLRLAFGLAFDPIFCIVMAFAPLHCSAARFDDLTQRLDIVGHASGSEIGDIARRFRGDGTIARIRCTRRLRRYSRMPAQAQLLRYRRALGAKRVIAKDIVFGLIDQYIEIVVCLAVGITQ